MMNFCLNLHSRAYGSNQLFPCCTQNRSAQHYSNLQLHCSNQTLNEPQPFQNPCTCIQNNKTRIEQHGHVCLLPSSHNCSIKLLAEPVVINMQLSFSFIVAFCISRRDLYSLASYRQCSIYIVKCVRQFEIGESCSQFYMVTKLRLHVKITHISGTFLSTDMDHKLVS